MMRQPLTAVSDLALPKLGETQEAGTYFEPGSDHNDQTDKQPLAAAGTAVGQQGAAARARRQARDPQQVEAAKIDLLDAIEQAEAEAQRAEVPLWGDRCPTFTYLAGAAGSGKTFATKAWAEKEKGLQLCATTGIAAINLGGETINSILGYFDTASLQESYVNGFLTAKLGRLWRAGVQRIILDEVSMLAGDQLDYLARAIDEVNGMGYVLSKSEDDDESGPVGMGLTLVGDFAQLPPVKATFAFQSVEWEKFHGQTITLTEIRRQADPGFIAALRAARIGDGRGALDYFLSGGRRLEQETDDTFEGPTLLAKNDAVDRYNWLRLSKLTGKDVLFPSTRWGKQRSEWGNPDKSPHTWGIPLRLSLKVGALVMVLANRRTPGLQIGEQYYRGELIYVNGDLGELVDANVEDHVAQVRLQRTGKVEEVEYVQRLVRIPCDSARRKELREQGKMELIDGKWEIAGEINYMPLRVAYASTVHKSQGLSLDRVQVNIRDGFFKTPGMLYVALSRARTAEGLRLVGSSASFIERCATDPRLKAFL